MAIEGVVASLPLGLMALSALALIGLGAAFGWLAAARRIRRRSGHTPSRAGTSLPEVVNALPQAALVVDADGGLIVRNVRAVQLLRAFGHDDALPLAVDAAVGRVIRSRAAETLEITSPGMPARRLQVWVAPLKRSSLVTEALLVLADPGAGTGRTEVYQQLTGMLAHELRTPLTAIMGHVEILGSCRIDEEALWRRSLGFVAGEVDRLARLVEDLLSLSRLDRIPLHLQPVNLRAAAEEAISALFEAAGRSNVTLVLRAPAELPDAQADLDRIRQVFLNLLDNAIKYAPGSTVTARLAPDAETVRVEIHDSGPGISVEDLPHIFDPFYRGGRSAPGAAGTGLGLTIVRTILDQHGASVYVHSAPDQGTTFAFSLPAAHTE